MNRKLHITKVSNVMLRLCEHDSSPSPESCSHKLSMTPNTDQNLHKKIKLKKAFSFTEFSVAILVIAIVFIAIIAREAAIDKAKISNARNLTTASSINNMNEVIFWFETSLENSFNPTEAKKEKPISVWYDNRSNDSKNNATQIIDTNKPAYFKSKNRLHTVAFNGANNYLNVDASSLNDSDYTICLVDKRRSGKANNYFIGDSSNKTLNQNLILGYNLEGKIIHSQGGNNSYNSTISNYSKKLDGVRIFCFLQDSAIGKKTYINGILAGQLKDNAKLSNISTLIIGKEYQGEIGEIVAFSRALEDSERRNVEEYLASKWSQKIYPGVSCTNGAINNEGCDITGCAVTSVGTTMTKVATGFGNLDCGVNGYKGTINYTCFDGVFEASDDCDNISCNIAGVPGIKDTSNILYTTSEVSKTCDANGYSGSINYTCTAQGPAKISGGCKPLTCSIIKVSGFNDKADLIYSEKPETILDACKIGYSGLPKYTCTTEGAADITGSCDPIRCSISGITGINDVKDLAFTTSPITKDCDANGYSGSVTYTCANAGAASIVGSCSPITCSISGVTGVNDTKEIPYSSTPAIKVCDAAGYRGSVTYTCTAKGAANVVGNCEIAYSAGHWVSIEDGYFCEARGPSETGYLISLICDYSHNGLIATQSTPFSTSVENVWGGGNIQGWYSCYCSKAGCIPSCSGFMATSYGGACEFTKRRISKCVYP